MRHVSVFTENGDSVPVSVIEIEANRVTQVKTRATDGYDAIQVTTGTKRAALVSKPAAGHYAKAKTGPGRGLWEFRLGEADVGKYEAGAELKADLFAVGQIVDVSGVTRGKGFAGTISAGISRWRRHHGNSLSHRSPARSASARRQASVQGKKMAGHMGNERDCRIWSWSGSMSITRRHTWCAGRRREAWFKGRERPIGRKPDGSLESVFNRPYSEALVHQIVTATATPVAGTAQNTF
jgi:large subunit ribosomal protein L3